MNFVLGVFLQAERGKCLHTVKPLYLQTAGAQFQSPGGPIGLQLTGQETDREDGGDWDQNETV